MHAVAQMHAFEKQHHVWPIRFPHRDAAQLLGNRPGRRASAQVQDDGRPPQSTRLLDCRDRQVVSNSTARQVVPVYLPSQPVTSSGIASSAQGSARPPICVPSLTSRARRHLGFESMDYTPLGRGFDTYYGYLGGGDCSVQFRFRTTERTVRAGIDSVCVCVCPAWLLT